MFVFCLCFCVACAFRDFFLLFGRVRVFFAVWAGRGELFGCGWWGGGGRVCFLLFSRLRVYVFAVWAGGVVFFVLAVWAGRGESVFMFLLFGRGACFCFSVGVFGR